MVEGRYREPRHTAKKSTIPPSQATITVLTHPVIGFRPVRDRRSGVGFPIFAQRVGIAEMAV